jgi:hypothetical protein
MAKFRECNYCHYKCLTIYDGLMECKKCKKGNLECILDVKKEIIQYYQ